MANYYVTQSGAGSANGTSLGNAWSIATFSGITTITGGDTVFISGTITSNWTVSSHGTSSVSRIIIDCSGAAFTPPGGDDMVHVYGNYITFSGGGSFSGGSGYLKTFTSGCVITFPALFRNVGPPPYSYYAFNSDGSGDNIWDGFKLVSNADGWGAFMRARYCNNNTIRNNYYTGGGILVYTDNTAPDGWLIQNNYWISGTNATDQIDCLHIGDATNMVIEGNYCKMICPGDPSIRHNDIIQFYTSGGGSSPYGVVIRYNWLEIDVPTGSGDVSLGQLESLTDNGATPALRMYGNVFVGRASTLGQGIPAYGYSSGTYYCYNNTWITTGGREDSPSRFLDGGTGYTLYAKNNIGYDISGTPPATAIDWSTSVVNAAYNYFYSWGSISSTFYGSGTGSNSTNPLFTAAGSDDFSLQSGSPCKFTGDSTIGAQYNQGIASGARWPAPSKITRSGGAWSIGAFEFGGGAAAFSSSLSGKTTLTGKATLR